MTSLTSSREKSRYPNAALIKVLVRSEIYSSVKSSMEEGADQKRTEETEPSRTATLEKENARLWEDGADQKRTEEAEPSTTATLETENARLRTTLTSLLLENKKFHTRLAGVKGLVRNLHGKREEVKSLTAKIEHAQDTVARAQNRIAQLSQVAAMNGDPSQGAIVVPGVSKKVLEALTRENTKLRSALDRLTNRPEGGVDLAVENVELHEIIMKLRDERDAKAKEAVEFETLFETLRSQDQSALENQSARLTKKVTKLEMQLNAKQVYCEAIDTENEALKRKLHSIEGKKIADVRQFKEAIGNVAKVNPEIREILNRVWDGDARDEGEDEDDARENLEEGEEDAADRHAELEEEWERLTNELREMREGRDHLREELEKTKAASEEFAAQADDLRRKLAHSQEGIRQTTEERNDLQAKLEELQNEHKVMQMALESYENDFKKEREEKNKTARNLETVIGERNRVVGMCEQYRRDYMDLRERVQRMHSSPSGPGPSRPREESGERVDGPPRRASTPRRAAPPRSAVPKTNELQCPECKEMFPCDWLEGHMRNCPEIE